jgi:hypothetical protein
MYTQVNMFSGAYTHDVMVLSLPDSCYDCLFVLGFSLG